jgi:hypothetical protein
MTTTQILDSFKIERITIFILIISLISLSIFVKPLLSYISVFSSTVY